MKTIFVYLYCINIYIINIKEIKFDMLVFIILYIHVFF